MDCGEERTLSTRVKCSKFFWQDNTMEESESSDNVRQVWRLLLCFRNNTIKFIMRVIALEMERKKDLGNDNQPYIHIGDKLNV